MAGLRDGLGTGLGGGLYLGIGSGMVGVIATLAVGAQPEDLEGVRGHGESVIRGDVTQPLLIGWLDLDGATLSLIHL